MNRLNSPINIQMEQLQGVEIYALRGKMGTGKDFLSKALNSMLPEKPAVFLALADQMKIECVVKDGLDREKVFNHKDEETRKALQIRGTEEGRDKYGEDIWIRYIVEWILQHIERGIKRFFIKDIRFKNEAKFFTAIGAVLFNLVAPKRNRKRLEDEVARQDPLCKGPEFWQRVEKLAGHISETDLDDYEFDPRFVIKNDYEDDGLTTLRDIVINELSQRVKTPTTFLFDLDDTICTCMMHYRKKIDEAGAIVGVHPDKFFEAHDKLHKDWNLVPFSRENFAQRLQQTASLFTNDKEKLQKAFEIGMSVHHEKFMPLNGALDALKTVRRRAYKSRMVIFTIGHRADQMRKVYSMGLHEYVDAIEVSYVKDESMFRYLMAQYPADRYFMFGDSLQNDIIPAMKCGISSFLVTSEKTLLKIVEGMDIKD